jgi:hypothetical protein
MCTRAVVTVLESIPMRINTCMLSTPLEDLLLRLERTVTIELMASQQQQQSTSSHAGGNGAIYKQEYKFGEVCDHEDVAMSVIKGGTILHDGVEHQHSFLKNLRSVSSNRSYNSQHPNIM